MTSTSLKTIFGSGRVWGLLIASLSLNLSREAEGATINAASVSRSDVVTAIASAVNGDVVAIPSGTAAWTSNVAITKAITLQGSGVGSTIIQNGVPVGSSPQSLLTWNLVANKTSRMTGIEFRETVSHQSDQTGCIILAGSNTNGSQVRVDHCKFQSLTSFNIEVHGAIGVIDHNTFAPSGTGIPIYLFHENWNDSTSPQPFGDGSRFAPTNFGSSQFMFIEDNTFNWNFASIDGYRGARWVFRHNNVIGGGWCEAHGIESSERYAGTRAGEIYNNTFSGSGNINLIANLRSGIFVIHDNTISGYQTPTVARLVNHRLGQVQIPWGEADGTSPWDVNLSGGPSFSGTTTGGGLNSNFPSATVSVAGNPWTTNQWVGYSVKKTSTITNMSPAAEIISNTSNTLTFARYGGSITPDLSFVSSGGETLAINKVLQSIDQPGRTRGSLIAGYPAIRPSGWNDQVTEPCYQWNNTYESGNIKFQPDSATIRAGEHYFDNTPMPGYTPYIYPHPLTTGTAGPSAPSNLRISGP